jgi:hypothetical protein
LPIHCSGAVECAITIPGLAMIPAMKCSVSTRPNGCSCCRSIAIPTAPMTLPSSRRTGCTAVMPHVLLILPISGGERRNMPSRMTARCSSMSATRTRSPLGGGLAPQRIQPSASTTMMLPARG